MTSSQTCAPRCAAPTTMARWSARWSTSGWRWRAASPQVRAGAGGARGSGARAGWWLLLRPRRLLAPALPRVSPPPLPPSPAAGEPVDWFGVGFFALLAAIVGGNGLKAWRRKREYAACRRALAKIKRVRWWIVGERWGLGLGGGRVLVELFACGRAEIQWAFAADRPVLCRLLPSHSTANAMRRSRSSCGRALGPAPSPAPSAWKVGRQEARAWRGLARRAGAAALNCG